RSQFIVLIFPKSKRDRDADDEQKKREYAIGWSRSVPRGVLKGRIDRAPRAGVVHERHRGDRDTAKDIERHKPRRAQLRPRHGSPLPARDPNAARYRGEQKQLDHIPWL